MYITPALAISIYAHCLPTYLVISLDFTYQHRATLIIIHINVSKRLSISSSRLIIHVKRPPDKDICIYAYITPMECVAGKQMVNPTYYNMSCSLNSALLYHFMTHLSPNIATMRYGFGWLDVGEFQQRHKLIMSGHVFLLVFVTKLS